MLFSCLRSSNSTKLAVIVTTALSSGAASQFNICHGNQGPILSFIHFQTFFNLRELPFSPSWPKTQRSGEDNASLPHFDWKRIHSPIRQFDWPSVAVLGQWLSLLMRLMHSNSRKYSAEVRTLLGRLLPTKLRKSPPNPHSGLRERSKMQPLSLSSVSLGSPKRPLLRKRLLCRICMISER